MSEVEAPNILLDGVVGLGCRESAKLMSGKPLASVVITTKNRKEELCIALRSAFSQSVPVEVLVVDDGSTDGTTEMVRTQFPEARLERSEMSFGLIVQRNRAARIVRGNIIFSIDDDAIFTSSHIIEQTLTEFDHPRIGAVAIPYVEPRKSTIIHQKAPSSDKVFVTNTFVGTAHALRKDVFLKLGGYREHLVHQGEESDYSIRMLNAGYLVRLGSADPIHHLESPRRDFRRMDYYGRRNDVLFAWHNVPTRNLGIHLVGTTLNGIATAVSVGRFSAMLQGLARGYVDCCGLWRNRCPVRGNIYRLHRLLKKRGPQLLSDIENLLPPLENPRYAGHGTKVAPA